MYSFISRRFPSIALLKNWKLYSKRAQAPLHNMVTNLFPYLLSAHMLSECFCENQTESRKKHR